MSGFGWNCFGGLKSLTETVSGSSKLSLDWFISCEQQPEQYTDFNYPIIITKTLFCV